MHTLGKMALDYAKTRFGGASGEIHVYNETGETAFFTNCAGAALPAPLELPEGRHRLLPE